MTHLRFVPSRATEPNGRRSMPILTKSNQADDRHPSDRPRVTQWLSWIAVPTALLATFAPITAQEQPLRLDPASARLERLRNDVTLLASPKFEGRSGLGAVKSAHFVEGRFRDLQLQPGFGVSYLQEIIPATARRPEPNPPQEIPPAQHDDAPAEASSRVVWGRNVAGALIGSDPQLSHEWIILSAHHDHLGKRGDVYYPGADDNASAVAMMLETARELTEQSRRGAGPSRSILFVAFDLEEVGLIGSRYFADHPPFPLDRVRLFITADMLGRSLAGVCDEFVFVMGSEHAPQLQPLLSDAAQGRSIRLAPLGVDVVGTRSDYAPFRSRHVPFLFFSTGESREYHTPRDVAETLNYPKLRETTELIADLVARASELRGNAAPSWSETPHHSLEEVRTIRDVLRRLQERGDEVQLDGLRNLAITRILPTLDRALERKAITPAERKAMVRVAQLVLSGLSNSSWF